MRANIHPELKDAVVKCACGATFNTKSVKDEIHVEVCSECHPFYTGAQGKQRKLEILKNSIKNMVLIKNNNYKLFFFFWKFC